MTSTRSHVRSAEGSGAQVSAWRPSALLRAVACLAAVMLAAGCTEAAQERAGIPDTPGQGVPGEVPGGELPGGEAPGVVLPAARLREQLEASFARHALLATDTMRARLHGAAWRDAASEVFAVHTRDLTTQFDLPFGIEGSDTIGALLETQRHHLLAFADALQTGDADAQAAARAAVADAAVNLGKYIEGVSTGGTTDELAPLFRAGAEHLLTQASAYAAGDMAAAYGAARAAFHQYWIIGLALAGPLAAAVPAAYPGPLALPGADNVRRRLLAEASAVFVERTRRAIDGARDAGAARLAQNTNTLALADALGSPALVGPWQAHADALVAVSATSEQTPDRAAAEETLAATRAAVAAALHPADPDTGLAELIAVQDDLVLTQAEAWRRGDFAQAFQLGGEALLHLRGVAPYLSQP